MPTHKFVCPEGVLHIRMTEVHHPVTFDMLRQLFRRSNAGDMLCVFERVVDGMYGVEAYVQFRSRWEAARARDALDGQAIYDGCCFLAVDLVPPIYTTITTPTADEFAPAYFYDDTPYVAWSEALTAAEHHDKLAPATIEELLAAPVTDPTLMVHTTCSIGCTSGDTSGATSPCTHSPAPASTASTPTTSVDVLAVYMTREAEDRDLTSQAVSTMCLSGDTDTTASSVLDTAIAATMTPSSFDAPEVFVAIAEQHDNFTEEDYVVTKYMDAQEPLVLRDVWFGSLDTQLMFSVCAEVVPYALCPVRPSPVRASLCDLQLPWQLGSVPPLSFPWNPGGNVMSTLATPDPYLHGHCPIEESWICNLRILNIHDLWVSVVELKPWPSWQHCSLVLLEHSLFNVPNGESSAIPNSGSWHFIVAVDGPNIPRMVHKYSSVTNLHLVVYDACVDMTCDYSSSGTVKVGHNSMQYDCELLQWRIAWSLALMQNMFQFCTLGDVSYCSERFQWEIAWLHSYGCFKATATHGHFDMVKYMHPKGPQAPDVSDCMASLGWVVYCARAYLNLFSRVLGLVLVFIPGLAAGQPGNQWNSFELELVTDSSLQALVLKWQIILVARVEFTPWPSQKLCLLTSIVMRNLYVLVILAVGVSSTVVYVVNASPNMCSTEFTNKGVCFRSFADCSSKASLMFVNWRVRGGSVFIYFSCQFQWQIVWALSLRSSVGDYYYKEYSRHSISNKCLAKGASSHSNSSYGYFVSDLLARDPQQLKKPEVYHRNSYVLHSMVTPSEPFYRWLQLQVQWNGINYDKNLDFSVLELRWLPLQCFHGGSKFRQPFSAAMLTDQVGWHIAWSLHLGSILHLQYLLPYFASDGDDVNGATIYLSIPWDPGGFSIYRLEGKPVFMKGGLSASLPALDCGPPLFDLSHPKDTEPRSTYTKGLDYRAGGLEVGTKGRRLRPRMA